MKILSKIPIKQEEECYDLTTSNSTFCVITKTNIACVVHNCIAKVNLDGCQLFTRKGESFAALPHIENQMIAAFTKIFKYVNEKYGVTEYEIDGELMPGTEGGVPLFSFNKLNGLVKNYNRTPEQEELAKTIEYHIYDVVLPVGYKTRDSIKNYFTGTHLKPLETIYVIATNETLQKYHDQFIEEGEEGLMIRQLNMPYENGRTWQLCKMKMFEDAEFVIVEFQKSISGDIAGAVICKIDIPSFDKERNPILTFKAGLKFSHEECKEIWENKSKYIGKRATICFFGRSEYNIPRFGKAIQLSRTDN